MRSIVCCLLPLATFGGSKVVNDMINIVVDGCCALVASNTRAMYELQMVFVKYAVSYVRYLTILLNPHQNKVMNRPD